MEVYSEVLHIEMEFWKRAVAKVKLFLLTRVVNEIQDGDIRQNVEDAKWMCLWAEGKSGTVARCV